MLGIGFTELVVIAIVALLFVKPDDLPRVMRELGRRYGQLRRAADELRRAFVLEADRQDAQERYRQLQERRRQAAEARQKAVEQAGEGTVPQERTLPGTEDLPPPSEEEDRSIGLDDPEIPAPRRAVGAEEER